MSVSLPYTLRGSLYIYGVARLEARIPLPQLKVQNLST